jgi:predicted protein tyrosine phosphatase
VTSEYESDAAAALKLTAEERDAAKALKAKRPEVIPNTRVIVSRHAALIWFDEVSAEMKRLKVTSDPVKVQAFCDLCGVPS